MKPEAYKAANQIWKDMAKTVSDDDLLFELDVHRKISSIFHVGEFYYYVFNIKHSRFDFISPEMPTILGYSPESIDVALVVNSMHPDDQPWFLNFENKVREFFRTLAYEQIPNYKISYDYRIKKANGDYIRILQQTITISYDKDGGLLRSLGIHTNISHIKSADEKSGKPTMSLIGLNGEPSYYNVDVKEMFKPSNTFITAREREILCLLVNGKNSGEIAELLYISKQTVDTHRKNLLHKTETTNSAELIATAIKKGWI